MLNKFENHINNKLHFLNESKILIAVSGGIDSVVLTHLCHKLKLNIALAHCNFNLRNEESDADEAFVLQLAKDLNLEVFVERFNTNLYAKKNKLSIQMAARELRYNWFKELAKQLQYNYILTAHHADDNLETFLINFTRGTGLEGLTGIPEINGNYVRPLLSFSSDNIKQYAKENHIKWRDDSSNKSVKYLRNKLRHELIPTLKEINPSLLESFQNTLHNLQESSSVVKDRIDVFLTKTIESKHDNVVSFKISEFKKLKNPKPYLYEVFKNYGFTQWNDIVNLLDAETGKHVLSSTHRLIKNREHLLLSSVKFENDDIEIVISEESNKIKTPFGTLTFQEIDTVSKQDSNVIYIDKALVEFPLVIRKKQQGDVFYPIGMTGKKKLSKYFKDEKMSLLEKENTWLLCSKNHTVIWVIGKRADNRFITTHTTKHILKIELVTPC